MFFYLVILFLPSWGVDFFAAFSRSFFWLRFVTLFRLDSDPCKLGDTNKTERQGVALHFSFPRRSSCVLHDSDTLYFVFIPLFPRPPSPPSYFFRLILFCYLGFSFLFYLSPFGIFTSSNTDQCLKQGSLLFCSPFWLFLSHLISSSIEDAALLGSLQNGIHVIQDQDQRAQRTIALQQRSPARTGLCCLSLLNVGAVMSEVEFIPSKIHCSYSLFDCLVI